MRKLDEDLHLLSPWPHSFPPPPLTSMKNRICRPFPQMSTLPAFPFFLLVFNFRFIL